MLFLYAMILIAMSSWLIDYLRFFGCIVLKTLKYKHVEYATNALVILQVGFDMK